MIFRGFYCFKRIVGFFNRRDAKITQTKNAIENRQGRFIKALQALCLLSVFAVSFFMGKCPYAHKSRRFFR